MEEWGGESHPDVPDVDQSARGPGSCKARTEPTLAGVGELQFEVALPRLTGIRSDANAIER